MKRLMYTLLLIIAFSYSLVNAHAAEAKDAEELTTLSTFYNETVSGVYHASSNAFVVPVAVAAQGQLKLKVQHPGLPDDYLVRIYNDDSYISLIQTTFLSNTEKSHTINMTMGAASTIYLYFVPAVKSKETNASSDAGFELTLTATLTPASEQTVNTSKTLSSKTWTKKRLIAPNAKHYYKVTVTGNKAVQISSNNTYLTVQLLDSKKKTLLSDRVALKTSNNFHTSFGLAKGTYYIKVTSDYQSTYQIYTKIVNVPTKYGKSIGKAKSLTLGSQTVGLLSATRDTVAGEYYKFKLSSADKISIAFYVENTGGQFMLEIYDKNYNEMPTSNYKCSNSSLLYINSVNSIPAGTYYLKITKTKQKTSGCYGLTVKRR